MGKPTVDEILASFEALRLVLFLLGLGFGLEHHDTARKVSLPSLSAALHGHKLTQSSQ